ncbi:UNVERIFIED_CONTAM: hypothetical protein Sangu_2358600 [Sesamum angustifolium]|uniref:Uncharacterized protein n=1 Tax=Sesamum angustifolium TaxID=2727405 RepID=A0AAW2KVT1_9LAMI
MVGFEVGAVPFNPDGWGPPDSSNAPLSIQTNPPMSPTLPSPAPRNWAGSPTGPGIYPIRAVQAQNREAITQRIPPSISPATTHSLPLRPTKTPPSALSTRLPNHTTTTRTVPNSIPGGGSMPTNVLSFHNAVMKKWRLENVKLRKNARVAIDCTISIARRCRSAANHLFSSLRLTFSPNGIC